jgi:AmmeMemoRadiSam system protein B/AmmeMemoRadiSam system protein A
MIRHPVHRIVAICGALLMISTGGRCQQKAKTDEVKSSTEVRKPAVAGAFYPDNPKVLAQEADRFLASVPHQPLPGRLIALAAPHAGYVYSGQVAAYAYKQIEGKTFDTVILIGSSHRAYFSGASLYDGGAYETPLGLVPVNVKMAREMMSLNKGLRHVPQAHMAEHSLEVQLPFLQRLLGNFRILPIVLGPRCSFEELEALAGTITQVVQGEGDVLLVASTDMSHYPAYDAACRVDRGTLTAMESFSPQAVAQNETRWLEEDIPDLSCTLCALEAVMVTMMAAKALGADEVEVLNYANSGDVPIGDRNRVVGYCAVAFYQRGGEISGKEMNLSEELNPQEQRELLKIARMAIEQGLEGERYLPPESSFPRLNERRGSFVTLHKKGKLRGCIGRFQPDIPLCQTVAQMAQAAAFSDRRFPPISSSELDQIEIEISVLSPLKEISSIDEIQLGTHGIWITREGRSGCFLPQVATETGWSKQEFLERCCQDKAFLSKDAYLQEGTTIYTFTAQVFHED